MTFDVAITSYKRPALVKTAVVSCLAEGPELQKVIVVDDASGDATAETLRALQDPRLVYVERKHNGGIAAARRDAFALSDSDWTISLDSDHELLPGAVERLAVLAAAAEPAVDILGARYRWDTGAVTPRSIPSGIIGYEERIRLSSKKDNIGADYLCAVSRRIRGIVRWEPLRSVLPDTLFQLDIAKVGRAKFTEDPVALQKSATEHSWTRGSAEQRWARRCQDAGDGVATLRLILSRHESGLRRWGRSSLARLYRQGTFLAILSGQRAQASQWLARGFVLDPASPQWPGLGVSALLPRRALRRFYLLRG